MYVPPNNVPQTKDVATLAGRQVIATARPLPEPIRVTESYTGEIVADVVVTVDAHATHADTEVRTGNHTLVLAPTNEYGESTSNVATINLSGYGVIAMLRRLLDAAEDDIRARADQEAQETHTLSITAQVGIEMSGAGITEGELAAIGPASRTGDARWDLPDGGSLWIRPAAGEDAYIVFRSRSAHPGQAAAILDTDDLTSATLLALQILAEYDTPGAEEAARRLMQPRTTRPAEAEDAPW